MADKTVLSGSKNCTYINPFNWDLYEIIQYKDRKCFTNDGKIIKWSDTFEMLKLFIKCCVNETGVWSAPGGKYKKFCSTSTDLALSWNYELGTLSFKGKVGDILKTLLTNICTDGKISSTKDRTLTQLEKKLSPKGNATIPINPDNNVIYITPQTNPQFTEPEVTKSTGCPKKNYTLFDFM